MRFVKLGIIFIIATAIFSYLHSKTSIIPPVFADCCGVVCAPLEVCYGCTCSIMNPQPTQNLQGPRSTPGTSTTCGKNNCNQCCGSSGCTACGGGGPNLVWHAVHVYDSRLIERSNVSSCSNYLGAYGVSMKYNGSTCTDYSKSKTCGTLICRAPGNQPSSSWSITLSAPTNWTFSRVDYWGDGVTSGTKTNTSSVTITSNVADGHIGFTPYLKYICNSTRTTLYAKSCNSCSWQSASPLIDTNGSPAFFAAEVTNNTNSLLNPADTNGKIDITNVDTGDVFRNNVNAQTSYSYNYALAPGLYRIRANYTAPGGDGAYYCDSNDSINLRVPAPTANPTPTSIPTPTCVPSNTCGGWSACAYYCGESVNQTRTCNNGCGGNTWTETNPVPCYGINPRPISCSGWSPASCPAGCNQSATQTNSCTNACSSWPNSQTCYGPVDNTPPPVPSISSSSSCGPPHTATFSWGSVSDIGCLGGVSYWLQIWDDAGNWYVNGWTNNTSYTINNAVDNGRVYTARVLASDGTNQSSWSTTSKTLTCACTVGGQSPQSGCYSNAPALSASSGGGANQTRFVVDNESGLSSPFVCDSGWISSNPASYSCSPSTGTYYWAAQSSSSTNMCTTSSLSPVYSFGVDKSAPPAPDPGTFTTTADPVCPGKQFVTYQWNPVTDIACGGLHTYPYWGQISQNNAFSTVVNNSTNGWLSSNSRTSDISLTGNVYGHSRARDRFNQQSAWSTTTSSAVPTPTLYPAVVVSGDYIEDVGTTSPVCPGGLSINPADLNLGITAPGATVDCTKNAGNYSCSIQYNNQANLCLLPNQTMTLNAAYSGYDAVQWRNGNVCGGAPNNSLAVDLSAPTPQNKNLFFKLPPSWFKLNSASFNSTINRNNTFPSSMQSYDSDDTPLEKRLSIKPAGGLITSKGGPIILGPSADASSPYSQNNWTAFPYNFSTALTPSQFIAYIKSRKEYKSAAADLSNLESNKINYISSGISIDTAAKESALVTKKPIVLVVDGNVSIDINNKFNSSGESVAILSTGTITFGSNTIEANGVFVGQRVVINDTSSHTDGLKILGNLVSIESITNNRIFNVSLKPVLFVVFNPKYYLDLLPLLSTSTYEWKQLQ